MTRTLMAAGTLLLAFSAAADITFDPPAPTSHSYVTLRVRDASTSPCDPEQPVVAFGNGTIDIRWTTGLCIPERVGGWVDDIPLGILEPGVYTVRLLVDTELVHTRTLVVTNGDAPIATLTPFASTRGGSRIVVFETADDCTGVLFNSVVLIDGIEVPSESSGCSIAAIAPAHAAGVVDLAVRNNGVTLTAPFALRYLDPAAPVDPAVFERVLLPVIYNGPGAFGSQWVTEVAVDAEHTDAFDWFHDFERVDLRDHPTGMMLAVARPLQDLVGFSLRIRDTSRSETSYGAEVPIARESDFRERLVFANVPFDPRYRLTLRLYSMTGGGHFYSVHAPGVPSPQVVPLIGPCAATPCASVEPSFAQVDLNALFPTLAGQGPRHIRVDSSHLEAKWGFITVTNNATQEVTVISPMR